MPTSPNNTELVEALFAAAPTLDEHGQRLARHLYQTLAEGEPVTDSKLANGTGLSAEYVAAVLATWPGVFRDDTTRIVGFWGLALSEMPHALEVNGVGLYAWCAWDTLFLPGILHATARVQSTDPHSGETIELVVEPDRIAQRSHAHTVVSFLLPDGRWHDDVMTTFCHYVHFFTDRESAAHWVATHPSTFLLDLDDAFALGTHVNRGRGFL